MAVCWVQAGICGQETSIDATRTSGSKVAVTFTTTCSHVEAMAEELKELDVGSELSQSAVETRTYAVAARHLCRSSCIVPTATLKVMEVTAGTFRAAPCSIEFLQDAI
jgi:hypothetical protein